MSGGVDSSTVAALLLEQGHDVFGITMQVLDDSRRGHIDDAAAVASHLGIPHHVIDCVEPFRREVREYFVSEYRSGRTPNPCARCNPAVKFGLLLDRAMELGAEYLATGHYARLLRDPDGSCRLFRGTDPGKDQSYFLFALSRRQLERVLFPLGDMTKARVRELAAGFTLPVKDKGESQEICFIPDDDYIRFLEEECGVTPRPGAVVTPGGELLGRHAGAELLAAQRALRVAGRHQP